MRPGGSAAVSRQRSPPRELKRQAVARFKVTFVTRAGEVQTEAAEDQYLLDVAVAAGLHLPYMCLQGWCTTCAAQVLCGKVDQSEARRIYPQDEAAGFVLLRRAHPDGTKGRTAGAAGVPGLACAARLTVAPWYLQD
ncbi:MAG: 2Fe-2S iron-sulfur cluster binding domain-containing protein [Planctomycetota bacterium]|nr:MAG: 2Fe-2S iron-sulfur cluster binding domain-containing protein [Planctomycetota bacterium]